MLQGHLAGAMMVTTNSAATVVGNSFLGNSVVNYGDFGGAVFHDYVRIHPLPSLTAAMCCAGTACQAPACLLSKFAHSMTNLLAAVCSAARAASLPSRTTVS